MVAFCCPQSKLYLNFTEKGSQKICRGPVDSLLTGKGWRLLLGRAHGGQWKEICQPCQRPSVAQRAVSGHDGQRDSSMKGSFCFTRGTFSDHSWWGNHLIMIVVYQRCLSFEFWGCDAKRSFWQMEGARSTRWLRWGSTYPGLAGSCLTWWCVVLVSSCMAFQTSRSTLYRCACQ